MQSKDNVIVSKKNYIYIQVLVVLLTISLSFYAYHISVKRNQEKLENRFNFKMPGLNPSPLGEAL